MKIKTPKLYLFNYLSIILLFFAAAAFGQATNEIIDVTPNIAAPGTNDITVTFTLDTDTPPPPPVQFMPDSVTIGSISGTSFSRPDQYTLTAVFDIPESASLGDNDVVIQFTTPNGLLQYTIADGFTIGNADEMPPAIVTHPQSTAVTSGSQVTFSVTASGTEPFSYQWQKDSVDIDGADEALYAIASVTLDDAASYQCIVTNDYGTITSNAATLTITTTPALEGYNLFSPMMANETYLMDNEGNIVHSWSHTEGPGLAAYLLEDGTLMRAANTRDTNFNVGGAGGKLEQYDWDGNIIWTFEQSSAESRPHHDFEVLPNGNILMIAWEYKTEAEIEAAGGNLGKHTEGALWPDYIFELSPTDTSGGDIIWEWHVWDHLIQDYDSEKPNYGVVSEHPEKVNVNFTSNGSADWNHINSIDYNAELDQILLSVHNFSEVWVIDHNTTTSEAAGTAGDLLYRWGNPQAYDAGSAADQQLFVQHDAEWIEADLPGEGDILIFNNGQGRLDGSYSSVDQITPPLNPDGSYTLQADSVYGPEAPTWSYVADPTSDFYAGRISGAQRLINGNTLICEGTTGRFFEVTSDGDIVWQYEYDGETFRVDRYTPDYEGFIGTDLEPEQVPTMMYAIVDTGQEKYFNNTTEIAAPAAGQDFYGQDAQYVTNAIDYSITDGGLTVTDNVTGLVWTRSHDWNNDGVLNVDDKMLATDAAAYAETLNAQAYAGHTDWRLPSIKQLYSLMNFQGKDPSGYEGTDTSGLIPFIDTDYFEAGFGDTGAGERIIDSQFATTTFYLSTTMGGNTTMFGLNLVDGRIKGYPANDSKTFYAYYVRGNTSYGTNVFVDNYDNTVTDQATGLMWDKNDSGIGLNWQQSLILVQQKNSENYLGYNNWRLPDAKELQSILDYTRCPDITASPAIDPVFNSTPITNEAGQTDYAMYWTSTTHESYMEGNSGSNGAYVCFGRAMGYWQDQWQDVHGAGAQRSDPKTGDPADYPEGHGPQGDAMRIYNNVRLVRTVQCGEPGYPYNSSDLDQSCEVSLPDFGILAEKWLDRYNINDLNNMAADWLLQQ